MNSAAAPTTNAGLTALRDRLLQRHGDSLQALLFYGSCLQNADIYDGVVDLYVLVSGYRACHGFGLAAMANRLLAPNVYYLEVDVGGRILRAKYAVVSLADFRRGTSMAWFHSYLWGRFAQPCEVIYARDSAVRDRIGACLRQARATFANRTVPLLAEHFDATELWRRGLTLSYSAELRAEGADRIEKLLRRYREQLPGATAEALAGCQWPVRPGLREQTFHCTLPAAVRRRCAFGWRLRRLQGKLLSLLRLMKSAFTFRGGVDYLLWKIERHSGVRIQVSDRVRRYPLLAGWRVFWELYRRGGFR